MTTTTFSAAPTNSAGGLNVWGKGVSDALAAVGMVKTADTGQIDWVTAPGPGSASTQVGYEIWRFDDALQSTAPIFFRIGYGSGTTSAGSPGLWFTIGKGSDGAGNITGQMMAQTQISSGLVNATASTWYVSSGDKSFIVVALGFITANATFNFSIERSRNASGAATATGISFMYRAGVNMSSIGINYAGSTSFSIGSRIPIAIPANTAADVILATSGVGVLFPAVIADAAGNVWQPRGVLAGMRSDVGVLGTSITVTGFNTYLSLGAVGAGSDSVAGAFAALCIGWW